MWKSKLPMKIKVFMRQACNDRIQSGEALKRMNWKGDPNCIVCRKTESADHIFFLCPLAKFVWGCLRDALGWERSSNSLLHDFLLFLSSPLCILHVSTKTFVHVKKFRSAFDPLGS
jgi:hypothetical protein